MAIDSEIFSMKTRPWIDDAIAANGRPISLNFSEWFGDSKVTAEGHPLVVYHGTGAKIEAFDPAITGLGNDQLGSGFYFTTDKDQACGYETALLPFSRADKIGGDKSPNTLEVFLSIKKPILLCAEKNNLRETHITASQAAKIIKFAPDILHPDNSPLANWIDNNGQPFVERDIKNVASSYSNLMSIEHDFFQHHATDFRKAVHLATGFDGVEKSFPDGSKHFVAWFPEQVKSVNNQGLFLKSSPSLTDADSEDALRKSTKAKSVAASGRPEQHGLRI